MRRLLEVRGQLRASGRKGDHPCRRRCLPPPGRQGVLGIAPSSVAHEAALLYQALQPELQRAMGGIGSQAAGNFARRVKLRRDSRWCGLEAGRLLQEGKFNATGNPRVGVTKACSRHGSDLEAQRSAPRITQSRLACAALCCASDGYCASPAARRERPLRHAPVPEASPDWTASRHGLAHAPYRGHAPAPVRACLPGMIRTTIGRPVRRQQAPARQCGCEAHRHKPRSPASRHPSSAPLPARCLATPYLQSHFALEEDSG